MHVLACVLLAVAAVPCHASILENAWRLLWPSKQQETVHVIFSNHLVRPPSTPTQAGSLVCPFICARWPCNLILIGDLAHCVVDATVRHMGAEPRSRACCHRLHVPSALRAGHRL